MGFKLILAVDLESATHNSVETDGVARSAVTLVHNIGDVPDSAHIGPVPVLGELISRDVVKLFIEVLQSVIMNLILTFHSLGQVRFALEVVELLINGFIGSLHETDSFFLGAVDLRSLGGLGAEFPSAAKDAQGGDGLASEAVADAGFPGEVLVVEVAGVLLKIFVVAFFVDSCFG